ncbi:MAG TPA: thiamine-phosphate kinase [Clostridia bacterium]|nr:thiamine-phosphate kinase [Clostridia bacterium]
MAGNTGAHLVTGIGDDCAVLRLPSGLDTLVTTDFSLEGVHFRREWHPAEAIGHRCLTRGLSDIAAMGGDPVAAFLSLALPANTPNRWVDAFFMGMHALAATAHIPLAGGDIAQSPSGVLADITVVGSVPSGKAILRSTAQAGDRIFVTGELGASAALLEQMFANPKKRFRPKFYPAHFYPQPQLAVARYLREKQLASAMIDISDGLSTDLSHICAESEVGAVVHGSAVPCAILGRHEVDRAFALHGGDEYQLLFTSPQGRRVPKEIAGVTITHIGYITDDREMLLEEDNGYTTELEPQGWEHFTEQTPGSRRRLAKRRK